MMLQIFLCSLSSSSSCFEGVFQVKTSSFAASDCAWICCSSWVVFVIRAATLVYNLGILWVVLFSMDFLEENLRPRAWDLGSGICCCC